ARRVIEEKIARPLGLTVEQAALGIHRVVNAQMAEGIRLMSINRGVDPREYALVALGGGGPLHGCALAQELYMTRVIIPSRPGVLSAIGLLAAPVEHESFVAYTRRFDEVGKQDVLAQLATLDEQCAALMRTDGVAPERVRIVYSADVCFIGQSYYLEVPLDTADPATMLDRLYRDFVAAHERIYGHASASPARIVNLRSVHRAGGGITLEESDASTGEARAKASRSVLLPGLSDPVAAQVYDRDGLPANAEITGPAIIEQTDTTTLVLPGWRARRLAAGDIMMTYSGEQDPPA
ncbi:MAG: hypothetical protein KIT18_03350, partial [Burkholderiales bacterium]|nr:hypothetical protein [Burkholderiales bacterium]